jgi:hypothetical protein
LSWSAPASGPVPSSYFLEVGSTSGATDLAAIDTGSAANAIAGAVAPGRYFLRVRARAGGATGPASNEVVVEVPQGEIVRSTDVGNQINRSPRQPITR